MEASRDGRYRLSGRMAISYFGHVRCTELGERMPFACGVSAVGVTVSDILDMTYPPQVGGSVISGIEVDVIALEAIRAFANEGSEYEPMHKSSFPLPVAAQVDSDMSAVPVANRGKHLPNQAALAGSSVNGSNSSEVGNLVEAFVSDNREPSFCGRILLSHWTSLSGLWSELRQAFARPAARFISGEFYHA